MRRAGYIVVGLLAVCALGYMAWFNADAVELRLGRDWSVRAPLGAQLIFAFLGGAIVVLAANAVRESRRAVARWRQQRRSRRLARVAEMAAAGRRAAWEGDIERGRALLLRALKARPRRETLLALAGAATAAGDLQEVRRVLQGGTAGTGEDPEVLCALAQACRRMGDTSGAITALERARRVCPRSPQILRELRDLYIDAERWSEAADAHAELLAPRPGKATLSEQAFLAGARYEAAMRIPGRETRLQALEDMVARFPRFVPAIVSLGDEMAASGRADEAVRLLENAFRNQPRAVFAERLTSMPGDRRAAERLGVTLRKMRGGQIDPDAVCLWLARLCTDGGRLDAAKEEIDGVSAARRRSPAFHRELARLNERLGHVDHALAAYKAAASGDSGYRCTVCGRSSPSWRAFCPPCRRWDTWRSELEIARE